MIIYVTNEMQTVGGNSLRHIVTRHEWRIVVAGKHILHHSYSIGSYDNNLNYFGEVTYTVDRK